MAAIIYREFSGAEHRIEVSAGSSVMEGAVSNNVPGIDAECGGSCACATCHVYVDDAWLGRLVDPSKEEADMLEFTLNVKPNSRLSCQIKVDKSLDGLIVSLPESQR